MSKLTYYDGYSLSQLRSLVECGFGGFTTASSIRGMFAGYGSTGNMAFATYSWIDSRCWTLEVYSGSGSVAILSPWNSGYTASAFYPPQSYAVTSNNNAWVTINASPDANYTFDWWMRADPWEIWSYSAYVSYYVPTRGWENTYVLGASFTYNPPQQNCYVYQIYSWTSWDGIDCYGNYTSGYSYYGDQFCLQYLYSGGYQTALCDPNCLVKGTGIEMADGTHKLIEKIRVGDVLKGMKISDAPEDDTIIGWSTDTLNLVETEVTVKSIVPISTKTTYIFNDGLIESSPEHGHFIKRGTDWLFKQTKDVQVGDFLVNKQGDDIEIETIEIYEHVQETETDPGKPRKIVYDINVETTDTFIANGLITHNRPIKQIN
jgi:hypothetical protein